MLPGHRCTESIESNVTGVQINELMKLPGITSNLRGLMQCLVPMLYIIRQLAVLEKEKSLEPFNPTCNLEKNKCVNGTYYQV